MRDNTSSEPKATTGAIDASGEFCALGLLPDESPHADNTKGIKQTITYLK